MELFVSIFSDFIHILNFVVIGDWILALKRRQNAFGKYTLPILTCSVAVVTYFIKKYNMTAAMLVYYVFIVIFIFILYVEKTKKVLLISIWLIFLIGMLGEISATLGEILFDMIGIENAYAFEMFKHITALLFVILVGYMLKRKSGHGVSNINNLYLAFFTLMTCADTVVLVVLAQLIKTIIGLKHKALFEIIFIIVVLGVFAQMAMLLMLIVSRDLHKEKELLMEKYLNEQIEHYEYLELREQETRKFRHDIRSHLYVLRSLYENQEYDQFDEYLEKINGRIDAFGNKISVNNSIVDAVLNKYLVEAEQKRVHLDVKGHFPTECSISAFDLCTIVSNLLSNAIEAAHRCGGKLVQIAFRYNEREIMISVENDYDGVILYEEGVMKTRKDDRNSHGFGLESIEECLKRNGGYMDIQTENFKFKTMLLLRDSNEEAV